MKYRINDLYYTIQGEGSRIGMPYIFLRFSGCIVGKKACPVACDTMFETGEWMTEDEIVREVHRVSAKAIHKAKRVLITGGEPLSFYDETLDQALRDGGVIEIACETSGAVPPKAHIDFITCSPKVSLDIVRGNFPNGVNELKFVLRAGQPTPEIDAIKADRIYISPEFDGDNLNQANLDWCIDMVQRDPQRLRLSVQTHKLLGVR